MRDTSLLYTTASPLASKAPSRYHTHAHDGLQDLLGFTPGFLQDGSARGRVESTAKSAKEDAKGAARSAKEEAKGAADAVTDTVKSAYRWGKGWGSLQRSSGLCPCDVLQVGCPGKESGRISAVPTALHDPSLLLCVSEICCCGADFC